MLLVSRDLFACKCSTSVPREDPYAGEIARKVRWVRGTERDIARLSSNDHRPEQIEELRARLRRGEYWVLGLLGARVASYTWLHTREIIDFPYLPGCTFRVAPGVGYGYDAWTPPDLRGAGLRRSGFLEELNVLREMGMDWESSFFVQPQIDGAKRSLGKVGIEIVPLWRVHLERDRSLHFQRLTDDDSAVPVDPTSHVRIPVGASDAASGTWRSTG